MLQIKTEMTSLYIRHKSIKKVQAQALRLLLEAGIIYRYDQNCEKIVPTRLTEECKQLITSAVPKFEEVYNKLRPDFFSLNVI